MWKLTQGYNISVFNLCLYIDVVLFEDCLWKKIKMNCEFCGDDFEGKFLRLVLQMELGGC
jgi:hypothetical protein